MAPKVSLTFKEYLHLLEGFGKAVRYTLPALPSPDDTQVFESEVANEELHRFDQLLDLDFDAQDALVEVPYDAGDQALLELEQALAGPPRRH
jgi:hypothetical protein